MTMRDTIITALTDAGLVFAPAAPTPDGLMQYIGTTRNRLTTVQLLGPAERPARIEALLGVPRDQPSAARFNGELAALLLRLALPQWAEGGAWFRDAAKKIGKRSPLKTETSGVTVTIEYRKKLGILVLRMVWPSLKS